VVGVAVLAKFLYTDPTGPDPTRQSADTRWQRKPAGIDRPMERNYVMCGIKYLESEV